MMHVYYIIECQLQTTHVDDDDCMDVKPFYFSPYRSKHTKKNFFSEIHKTDFSFFHSISLIFTSLPIHRFIHYLDNKKNEHFRYWIILAWCSVNVKFEITFFCFLLPNFYRKVLFFSILFRFWNKFGTKMWAKTFFAFNVKWI